MKASPNPTTTDRDVFSVFAAEVHHLHATWVLWRRLFDRDDEPDESAEARVRAGDEAYRVTGESAPIFFLYARWHMLRGVMLDLSRLCDPKGGGERTNLTLERILEETNFSGHRSHEQAARAAMCRAHEIVRDHAGLKGLRNQLLAHLDLDTALGRGRPADVDIDEIHDALRAIVEFTHRLSFCRRGDGFDLQSPSAMAPLSAEKPWKDDADSLVRLLGAGLRVDREPSERTAPAKRATD